MRKGIEKMLTTSEVADRLGVAGSSVRIWLRAGRFPHAKSEETPRGKVWYIPESDVDGFEKRERGRPPKIKEESNGKKGKAIR
jgi:excisionase family DNA binding protein